MAGLHQAELPSDIRITRDAPPEEVSTQTLRLDTSIETNRWYGLTAIALVIVGVGIIVQVPSMLLIGAVGIWFALYYRLWRPPDPHLEITRKVEQPEVVAGEEVMVTLSIKNIGSSLLPDISVIEGIPYGLSLESGSSRLATSLWPGQETSVSYTVTARRGYHSFEPITVISRDLAGSHEAVYKAETDGSLQGKPHPDPLPIPPLRQLTMGITGRLPTAEGGSGLEFHAVREYRSGDPLNRVDWRRKARTGELATIEFRQEQMATVMLVIDVRTSSYVSPPGSDTPAVDVCVDGAMSLFNSLLDAGDRVGVTTLGDRDIWLPPGVGSDHRAMGDMLFRSHPSLGPQPPGQPVSIYAEGTGLFHRIHGQTQLIFLSPLTDIAAEYFATMFEARDHPVTIVSPDPTGDETPGQQLSRIERSLRISRLRERGIRVLDWEWGKPLASVIERASVEVYQ